MPDRHADALVPYVLKSILGIGSDAALAYSWGKVCFTTWDYTLEAAGERLLGYSRWPEALRLLLHSLYPTYFVYGSMKRLSGPEGPSHPADSNRWRSLLVVACVALGVLGMRAGQQQRGARTRSDA